MNKFMLDTNAINKVLDNGIKPAQLSLDRKLYITHIQLNEIQATNNTDRRNDLLTVFKSIKQEAKPTAAAVFDVSEFGDCEFGDGDGSYTSILSELNELNGGKRGNERDALIAVTAIKHRCILVTDDQDLKIAVTKANGSTLTFEEFVS